MAETQTYSHEEIQRYLQQKMSPQEMHEFEKTLMNDPFLADAMEGYSASDPVVSAQHLHAIERALTGEEPKAKVIPLVVKKTAWWKVASVILIIVSAGTITWSVLNDKSSYNTNKDQPAASTAEISAPKNDSIGPVNKPLAQVELLPGRQEALAKKKSPPIIRTADSAMLAYQKSANGVGNELRDRSDDEVLVPPPATAAPVPSLATDEVLLAQRMRLPKDVNQNEFKGKVVDKSGEPLPFASSEANKNRTGTIADGNGNFSLRATDSVLEVKINSPGYASSTTQIKSNKADNRITLKEDAQTLAEVVVTRMAKKKRSSETNLQADSLAAAEPVGGWKNFRQYMNQQLDSLKAVDDMHDFDEDIVLEFLIDKKGHPTNIKAPAEIDKMMAEKAIDILTHGPRWKNKKKDKKVKVIIAF